MGGHQDKCMIRNEAFDSLISKQDTRMWCFDTKDPEMFWVGFFNLTLTISKLGVQPEEVS